MVTRLVPNSGRYVAVEDNWWQWCQWVDACLFFAIFLLYCIEHCVLPRRTDTMVVCVCCR